jgi:DNA-binding FadR family transcriptional regulator
VNRVTVRSALARLMSEGLLSVRQGRGYEVQDFESESGPTLLPSVLVMARGHSERELAGWVEDMLAARRHLGRAALLELADRQPDTTGVTAALDAFTAAVAAGDSDPRELAALDMDVVRALLEAAGNRVLRLAFNPVLSALAALPELEAQLYAAPHTNVAGYALLRAWLKAPDVTGIEPLIAALAARDRSNVARLTAPRTPAALRKQP